MCFNQKGKSSVADFRARFVKETEDLGIDMSQLGFDRRLKRLKDARQGAIADLAADREELDRLMNPVAAVTDGANIDN